MLLRGDQSFRHKFKKYILFPAGFNNHYLNTYIIPVQDEDGSSAAEEEEDDEHVDFCKRCETNYYL